MAYNFHPFTPVLKHLSKPAQIIRKLFLQDITFKVVFNTQTNQFPLHVYQAAKKLK